jgi:hypothetical protein
MPQCAQDQWAENRSWQTGVACNAVRHELAAETVVGALEDAEDYKALEVTVTANYDAQATRKKSPSSFQQQPLRASQILNFGGPKRCATLAPASTFCSVAVN